MCVYGRLTREMQPGVFCRSFGSTGRCSENGSHKILRRATYLPPYLPRERHSIVYLLMAVDRAYLPSQPSSLACDARFAFSAVLMRCAAGVPCSVFRLTSGGASLIAPPV